MRKIREWILHWLLGGEAKSWEDMFHIACECNADCGKLYESNNLLLEKYKELSDEYLAVLNAVCQEDDVWKLKAAVTEILKRRYEKQEETNVDE